MRLVWWACVKCLIPCVPHNFTWERPGPLIQNNGIDGILVTDTSACLSWRLFAVLMFWAWFNNGTSFTIISECHLWCRWFYVAYLIPCLTHIFTWERPGPIIQNNGIDGILVTDASASLSWWLFTVLMFLVWFNNGTSFTIISEW